jgi:hypothetical protein
MTRRLVALSAACVAVWLSCAIGGVRTARAECFAVVPDDPIVRMRASSAVYVAQVLSTTSEVGWQTAEVKVLRSWKGKGTLRKWAGSFWAEVGETYLVFEYPDNRAFDAECGYVPIPASKASREMDRLNRYRGYPPLVLPSRRH